MCACSRFEQLVLQQTSTKHDDTMSCQFLQHLASSSWSDWRLQAPLSWLLYNSTCHGIFRSVNEGKTKIRPTRLTLPLQSYVSQCAHASSSKFVKTELYFRCTILAELQYAYFWKLNKQIEIRMNYKAVSNGESK